MVANDNLVTTMPVTPAYGGGGFGGGFGNDWGWIILLLLFAGGGWGNGGFGGGYDFPWLMNGQQGINTNTNNGFQNALLNDNITSVRDGIAGLSTQMCNGFGNVATQLCGGFAGVNATINGAQDALAQQMYANQIADMQQNFAAQTATMQGFNGIQSGLADVRYAEATEACATRNASAQNTRDIIDSQTRGTQAILDKLCALELDGVKGQLAQAQRENLALQNQVNMATMQASQAAQTAVFKQGLNDEVDALYNRLKNCPVGTTPVYGNQPIFTCGGNGGCGCGGM